MTYCRKHCAGCGENIDIVIHQDGVYTGGHYFGTVTIPEHDAHIIEKETKDGWEVVKYSSYQEIEYWECESCYDRRQTENS